MKRVALTVLIAAFAVIGAAAPPSSTGRHPGYSYYEIGKVKTPRPARTERALLLVGGGDWNLDAFRWFAARAGHGHLVVIAAYGDGEDGKYFYRDVGGFASVQTLVFTNRKASYDPRVLRVLRNADAIFIAGGDQSKYVRFWKGTPVAQAIDLEVAQGRPVGGTSAGLAVLGAYAYGAMDGGSIDSPTALANPLGPAVTMVRDFLHMPFLSHVVTDTHFSARNRLGRSIAFLAKVRTNWDPTAIGLAIDQDSALCVDAHGIGHFFTNKDGKAWLLEPAGMPQAISGKPLDWASVRITRFGPSGSIDLKTMRVRNPSSRVSISVVDGRLRGI
jgi:beta-aspartyl-peptidase (threonine type)